MIISKFNKYVEKHGRVTYIVLGIIICFMFVIFVTPESAGGCRFRAPAALVMFGKKVSLEDFQNAMRMTEVSTLIRTGRTPSQQGGDALLRQMAVSRLMLLHAAKQEGFYKAVKKEEIATAIRNYAWLQNEKGEFSLELFDAFKNNVLSRYALDPADFDEIVRQDLAMERMEKSKMEGVEITEEEIDSATARIQLMSAEIPADIDAAGLPTDAEIEAFFHSPENAKITADQQKTAVLAIFPLDVLKEKEPSIRAKCQVSEQEVAKLFESQKDKAYKGKTLEQMSPALRKYLEETKLRSAVRVLADSQPKELIEEGSLDAEKRQVAFQNWAKKSGASLVETGAFCADAEEIPGFAGKHAAVVSAVHRLERTGAIGRAVLDGRSFVVPLLKESSPAPVPSQLTAAWKKKIADHLLKQKATAWYDANIGCYANEVPNTTSVWDLGVRQAQGIRADNSLSPEMQNAKLNEITSQLLENVMPFYQDEQRSFSVAEFPLEKYKSSVTLTEEDFLRGYEARKEEYTAAKVHISLVMVNSADDSEKARAASKAKAEEALAKIKGGTAFAKVAQDYSDHSATREKGGDCGWQKENDLSPEIAKVLSSLRPGQLSAVIPLGSGYGFIKLEGRQAGRTLEQVRAELKEVLTLEEAKRLALEEATRVSQALHELWEDSGKSMTARALMLKEKTKGTRGIVQDYPLQSSGNSTLADSTVKSAVFSLKADNPFSDVISGKNGLCVACLSSLEKPSLLPPEKSMGLLLSLYKKQVAAANAYIKGCDEVTRIQKELSAGKNLADAAKPMSFRAMEKELTQTTLFEALPDALDASQAWEILKDTQEKSLAALPMRRRDGGCTLLYISSRKTETNAAIRAREKERLHSEKGQRSLMEFYRTLQQEADVQLNYKE